MGQPCTSETPVGKQGQDRDVTRGEEQDEGAAPADKPPASEGPRRLDLTVFPSKFRGSVTSLRIRRKRGWRKRTEPQEEGRRRLPSHRQQAWRSPCYE